MYVDDINLLDVDLVTMMLQAVTDGFVIVEREGISVKYPCRPMMIATLNPEDSELKDVFLDRIGIALNADSEPLSMEDRVRAVDQVLTFQENRMDPIELAAVYEKEEQLKASIIFAREYLKGNLLFILLFIILFIYLLSLFILLRRVLIIFMMKRIVTLF